jgi:intracellular multiplication protein IcmT
MYSDPHWRDSARTAKFFKVDGRIFFVLLISIFHFTIWTLVLSVITFIFFMILNSYKITIIRVLYIINDFFFGRKKKLKQK